MSKKTEKNAKSFEEELKRLEEIVENLEKGLPIEEALNFYEEGVLLSSNLEQKLSDIERKVYEVKNITKLVKSEDKAIDLGLFE